MFYLVKDLLEQQVFVYKLFYFMHLIGRFYFNCSYISQNMIANLLLFLNDCSILKSGKAT